MSGKAIQLEVVNERLSEIPGWKIEEGKLIRELEFSDFNEAFALMTKLAAYSEEVNHHPGWFNVYNKLRIQLDTHDVGGISEKDFDWAKHVNSLV